MTGTHCHTAGAKSKENEYTIMIASALFFVNPIERERGSQIFWLPLRKTVFVQSDYCASSHICSFSR